MHYVEGAAEHCLKKAAAHYVKRASCALYEDIVVHLMKIQLCTV